ncbi:squamous cell carcinoma antigen recognized by T-cells 3-like [Macrobrachium rosenbergii]|uniref:squamous cell carcinoma antigen recognized by T-cells 3-like n=1 Tax=Macrobrachium rosenbergii TaxID=79674 RepID=UPI0034D7883C
MASVEEEEMEYENEEEEEDELEEHLEEEEELSDEDEDEVLDAVKEEALRYKVQELKMQLARNVLCYEAHVNLIGALRSLVELEGAREAREAMHKLYPLSPELWLDWVRDEQKVCTTKEERDYITTLFDRAVKDYTSVQAWVEYVMFMLGGGDMDATRAVGDQALMAVGTHVAEGILVWQVVLLVEKQVYAGMQKPGAIEMEDEKKNLEKQLGRIQDLYRRQARVPLLNLDPQSFLDEAAEYFGGSIEPQMRVDLDKAQKKLDEKIPFEDELLKCDSDQERLTIYRRYISFVQDTDNPAAVQSLYERAVTDHCLDAGLWEEYVRYLLKQFQGLDYVVLPVCERSQRNCPWSASLCSQHIRALQLFAQRGDNSLTKKIKGALEIGLGCGLQSGSEATRMWMAYLVYLRRQIDWDKEFEKPLHDVREACQQAIEMIDDNFGEEGDIDSEVARFWARIETELAKNPERSREIWNDIIMKRNDNFKNSSLWLEFINLERSYGSEKHCRKLFRRALERVWDSVEVIGDAYRHFEQEVGTLDTMEDFIKRYDDRMAIVRRKRAEDAAKLQAEEDAKKDRFSKMKDRGRSIKRSNKDRQTNGHSQDDAVFKAPLNVPKKPKGFTYEAVSSQSMCNKDPEPPPSFRNAVAPPPGFTSNAGSSGGSKSDMVPPPGFKDDGGPPPGYKGDVAPPPGFKRKADGVEAEAQAKKAKLAEAYGICTDKDTDDDLTTVFISNLAFGIDKQDIIPLFSGCGEIKDFRLVKDYKCRSKGYGYLVFKTQEAVKKALEMDRVSLNDRPVYVSKYDPEGQSHYFKYAVGEEKNKLFIRGLPFDMSQDDVKEAFLPHGEIKDIRLVSFRNGYSKGTCYIEYQSEEMAEKVRQAMDGKELRGKVISVLISNPPSKDKSNNPKPTVKEDTLGSKNKGKNIPGARKKGMFDLMPRSLMRASGSSEKDEKAATEESVKPKSNDDFRKMFLK